MFAFGKLSVSRSFVFHLVVPLAALASVGFQSSCFGQVLIAPPKINPASPAPMKTLLNELWESSLKNKQTAQQLFSSQPQPTSELTLAFVANQLEHGDSRAASKALVEATSRDPKFIDGWLLLAHLEIMRDEFEAGLSRLRAVKNQLKNPELEPKRKLQSYYRAGELMGYLGGPVAHRIDQNMVKTSFDFFAEGASAEETKALNDGHKSLMDKYNGLAKTTGAKVEQELQKKAEVNAHLQVSLTAQNETLSQTAQNLSTQQRQVQNEFGQRESQLSSQLSPLQASVSNLETQVQTIQWNLNALNNDLFRVRSAPVICRITEQAILDQIYGAQLGLNSLQANYQSAIGQLQSVQNQLQQLRANYTRQNNDIERELKRISGTIVRNQNQISKTIEGPKLTDEKKQAIDNRITALSTYVKIPTNLLKQELSELIQ